MKQFLHQCGHVHAIIIHFLNEGLQPYVKVISHGAIDIV